jgi:hypothetical protein
MHDDRAWVATRKGLFELQRLGLAWRIARTRFVGEPVTMLLPPDAQGRMLAALNLGHFGVKLHASDDAGATWREVAAPAYPPQPADNQGPDWKLVQVWALERAGAASGPAPCPAGCSAARPRPAAGNCVHHCGTSPAQRLVRRRLPVPGHPLDLPAPAAALRTAAGHQLRRRLAQCRPRHQLGAARQGHARRLHAARAGRRPEHAGPAPHRALRCAARGAVVPASQRHLAQHRQRRAVARAEAPVSSFGFAVAVHPQHAGTAWFVPAQADERRVPVDAALVVNRTRDGGRSWQTLRQGLPQQTPTTWSTATAWTVGSDGRTLLMGSTTGHLWASFDAGDHWTAVLLHLPPIAAVRLG